MHLSKPIIINTLIGLNLSPDLSWSHHIDLICTKTRKLVGMLYRNFYKYSSSPTLLKLYKALIRPHLEYAGVVWDPYLVKDIVAVENVQKFALRVCSKQWNSSYDALLNALTVPTLLTIPHCHTNSHKHSFFVHAPKLWNDLPFDVAAINSVTVLKHKLINAQL